MKQKSLKNTIRNIALVVLTLLMVSMTLLNGVWAMDGDSLRHAFRRSLGHANLGYEVRSGDSPAAYPSSIAMTGVDGALYGAAYHERTSVQLYEATSDLMGGALGSVTMFEPLTEEGLKELLKGETLCYAYNGEIPLSALAAWMESQSDSTLRVSMLLLTAGGQLALRTREQGLVVTETSVDRLAWQHAASALNAGTCSYAGLSEQPVYRRLAGETLLTGGPPMSIGLLAAEAPAFGDPNAADSLQTLLGAFSYSMYARSYQERGSQVYVDNDSTLRVSGDGTVQFTAARREEEQPERTFAEIIEQARVILERAQYSIGAGTQVELLSVSDRQDGGYTLLFGQLFDGIPIVTEEPFARFDFAEGQLIRAVIHLRRYTASEDRQYILPTAQAAAAAERVGQRLGIAYTVCEDGRYAAERCFTFAP